VVVLAQPDQFAAASDLGADLDGALGQQTIGGGLRDAEDVRMRGVQPVGPALADAGEETADLVPPAVLEEPLQQTALVHHLDAAHMQAERTDHPGRLQLLLQHDHVHAVQPQLAGQHQAGRSTAGNDHVDHHTPHFRRFWLRPAILRHDPGLAASPPVRYTLRVARSA
jgi:hypothetical protein